MTPQGLVRVACRAEDGELTELDVTVPDGTTGGSTSGVGRRPGGPIDSRSRSW